MDELEQILPGASIYCTCQLGSWGNFACYMSNFSIVVFELDTCRYYCTIQAPWDLLTTNNQRESSGLACMAMSPQGKLAVVTQLGNMFLYDMKNPEAPYGSISLDTGNLNPKQLANRLASQVSVQLVRFHPSHSEIMVAYELEEQVLLIMNVDSQAIVRVRLEEPVNELCFAGEKLVIGTALEGKLLVVSNFHLYVEQLLGGKALGDKKAAKQLQIQYLHVGFGAETELRIDHVERDTVFTTPYLQWVNINYGTCFELALVGDGLLFSAWYGGWLLVHQTDTQALINRVRLPGLCSCCAVPGSPGLVALGFGSGVVRIVSGSALSSPCNTRRFGALESLLIQEALPTAALREEFAVPAHHGAGVIRLEPAGNCLHGVTSNGVYFVYNLPQKVVQLGIEPGHTESVFAVHWAPNAEAFMSVSADTTARVWRDSAAGIRLEQQFGAPGYQRARSNIDSRAALGSLLACAWDPRPGSCLALVSSFKGAVSVIDAWRNNILVEFPRHGAKVSGIAWTNFPACAACSAGFDGTARLYMFERPVKLGTKLKAPESLEENFVQFVDMRQYGIQLTGCAFSETDPLLALCCSDGYLRLYDTSVLAKSDEEAARYYAEQKISSTNLQPALIGKFGVSHSGLFSVKFHKRLRNTVAVTMDSGEVKVYRYEFQPGAEFKIQCVATLVGHRSNSRPLCFHPELPNILVTGSWDGSVIVWDWVQQRQLTRYQLGSDVYGLDMCAERPFEVVVSSRDLTIRKLYLRDLAQQCVGQMLLQPLGQVVAELQKSQQVSAEKLHSYLKQRGKEFCTTLEVALRASFKVVGYSNLKQNLVEKKISLTGAMSQKCAEDLAAASSSGEAIAMVAGLFYPQWSGAKELLKLQHFYQTEEFDTFLDIEEFLTDEIPFKEWEASQGVALSARSLAAFANWLGSYYLGALIQGKAACYQIPAKFKERKYTFYEFQRKLPQHKIDAYKYQFQTGLALLASVGNYEGVIRALQWAGMQDQLVFYEDSDDYSGGLAEDPESLGRRLRPESWLPVWLLRLVEAGAIYWHSGDEEALRQVVSLLECQSATLAKLVAYQIRDVGLYASLSQSRAVLLQRQRKPLLAAAELFATQHSLEAIRLLSVSGEHVVASLCGIAEPEALETALCIAQAAEQCPEFTPMLVVQQQKNIHTTLPRWMDAREMAYVIAQNRQIATLADQATQPRLQNTQLDELIAQARTMVSQAAAETPERVYHQLKLLLEADAFLGLCYRCGGETPVEQIAKANSVIVDLLNQAVKARVAQKKSVWEYAGLYQLARYKPIVANTIQREAAVLGNYVAAQAAQKAGYWKTAAQLYSQAEKAQADTNALETMLPPGEFKKLKLLAVLHYNQNQQTIEKLKQMNMPEDAIARVISEARQIETPTDDGTRAVRYVLSPFNLEGQSMQRLAE